MNQGSFKLLALLLVGLIASPAIARPLKKTEANQIIPEGEYLVKGGRRVASYQKKKSKAKYAANSTKKRGAKKVAVSRKASKKLAKSKSAHSTRQPASSVKSKKKSKIHRASKKRAEKHSARASSRKMNRKNASHARSRRQDSDLPLVSGSRNKSSRPDRMIVMDDPAVKNPLPRPRAVGAGLTPEENVLDPDSESPPSEVGEAKAAAEPPVVVGPAPASVTPESAPAAAAPPTEAETAQVAAESASREPDAFDLHSGQDPMQGP